jgi:ketosteroid isomerase-like protein
MTSTTSTTVAEFLTAWAAAETAGDPAAVDACLDEEFEAVGPLGFRLTRADWLDRHRAGDLTYSAVELDEVDVRTVGGCALVVARQRAEGSYRGNPVPGTLRTTFVLRDSENAGWRLVHIHLSFVAGTPGAPAVPGQR